MKDNPQEQKQIVVYSIPLSTFFKIAAVSLLMYWAWILWPLFLLTFIGILLAITLQPFVSSLEERKVKHAHAVLIVSALVLSATSLLIFFGVPELKNQIGHLSEQWPKIKESLANLIPQTAGTRGYLLKWSEGSAKSEEWIKHFLSIGQIALGGVAQAVIVSVIGVYFLLDGARAYRWLVSYCSPENKAKMDETSREVSEIIFAYVGGQIITSLLAGFFAFVVLSLFHIPGALVLGVAAAIFDVLPIVGFFLFMVPAIIMALTVSSSAAFWVGIIYLLYHQVENYFLIPWIYGSRLRLSTIVVLLSCLFAGSLGGVLATIAVLPIVAAYPVIERIWFAKQVAPAALRDHNQGPEKAIKPEANRGTCLLDL